MSISLSINPFTKKIDLYKMFCPSSPLTHLPFLQTKSPSSTLTVSAMKLKYLLQTLFVSQVRRAARSISKTKFFLITIKDFFVSGHQFLHQLKKSKRKHKINLYGSFRLHYNWSSSHVAPEPPPTRYSCYSGTPSTTIPTATVESVLLKDPSELSGYLHWLEEKGEVDGVNEIDKLAEMFIATCHEKFLLEKQESYRLFQEMMARSL